MGKLKLLLLLIGLCAISWHNVIAENDEGAIDQQEADNEQEFSSKDAVIPDAEGQDSNDDESEDESQDDENPEDLAYTNEDETSINDGDPSEDTSVSKAKDSWNNWRRRRLVLRRRQIVVLRRRQIVLRRRRCVCQRRRIWVKRVSSSRRRSW